MTRPLFIRTRDPRLTGWGFYNTYDRNAPYRYVLQYPGGVVLFWRTGK